MIETTDCPQCGNPKMYADSLGATKTWTCNKCGVVTLRKGKVRSSAAALLLELCAPDELKAQIRAERRRRAT
jgi:ribosomal protein L37AE/L43A